MEGRKEGRTERRRQVKGNGLVIEFTNFGMVRPVESDPDNYFRQLRDPRCLMVQMAARDGYGGHAYWVSKSDGQ